MDWSHNRFSDDNIYLNEDRYQKPKEVHKEIISIIQKYFNQDYTSVLDCGCATGALLYNIQKVYPHLELNGFDISQEMIEYAKKKLTNTSLFVSDLGDDFKYKDKKIKKSDIVICSGVLSIFDDYKKIINNLIISTNKNGIVIIHGQINPDPVDVIMRYRRADGNEWEGGRNIISKYSLESYLKSHSKVNDFEWNDYNLGIDVPKRIEDPMRTWTAELNKKNVLLNGACQVLHSTNLVIRVG